MLPKLVPGHEFRQHLILTKRAPSYTHLAQRRDPRARPSMPTNFSQWRVARSHPHLQPAGGAFAPARAARPRARPAAARRPAPPAAQSISPNSARRPSVSARTRASGSPPVSEFTSDASLPRSAQSCGSSICPRAAAHPRTARAGHVNACPSAVQALAKGTRSLETDAIMPCSRSRALGRSGRRSPWVPQLDVRDEELAEGAWESRRNVPYALMGGIDGSTGEVEGEGPYVLIGGIMGFGGGGGVD